MSAKPIPDGFHTVTPHITVRDGEKAIEFYKKAFGAEERTRMPGPDGNGVIHAEIRIGNSPIMIAGEMPGGGGGPKTIGGTPVTINLYVEDADAVYNRAISAGASVRYPMEDAFWGDRYGQVEDPEGHVWAIATHKEDLTDEQIGQRAQEFFARMAGGEHE